MSPFVWRIEHLHVKHLHILIISLHSWAIGIVSEVSSIEILFIFGIWSIDIIIMSDQFSVFCRSSLLALHYNFDGRLFHLLLQKRKTSLSDWLLPHWGLEFVFVRSLYILLQSPHNSEASSCGICWVLINNHSLNFGIVISVHLGICRITWAII